MKLMKLEEAIELDFEDYIAWCWEYYRELLHRDPIAMVIHESITNHGGAQFLEAGWAKRYWFHHAGKVKK